MGVKKDLTNQKFNQLLVLFEVPKEERRNIRKVEWRCQCDCGNQVNVVSSNLLNGHTKSCGCWRAENMRQLFSTSLVGEKYGKLLVLDKTEKRGSDGSIMWQCKCDCGKIHYVSTNSLKTGAIASCGCQRSRGEAKINELLLEQNINYQTQYWFTDLKDKKYLYFDFAIFNENNELYCLLEYQGIQHYQPEALHGTWKNSPTEHDIMKKEYCQKHNIKLIEIPYTDYNKLNWEYLKNKLSL